jgi:hypothetical protein
MRHKIRVHWDFNAVAKRWGKRAKADLLKAKPLHQVITVQGGSEDNPHELFKLLEDDDLTEVTFLSNEAGQFVYIGADGEPLLNDGKPVGAPGLLSGATFKVRLTELRLRLAGCGCFINSVDGPNMIFELEGTETPHPTFRARCTEVGVFPMEWFYRPFLDAAQLKVLLLREFNEEVHFDGDEVHFIINLQIPKPSSILRKFLKLLCGMVLSSLKLPVDEDIVATIQGALGEDFKNLEQHIKSSIKSNDPQDISSNEKNMALPSSDARNIESNGLSSVQTAGGLDAAKSPLSRPSSQHSGESSKSGTHELRTANVDLEFGQGDVAAQAKSSENSSGRVRARRRCFCLCRKK